MSEYKRLTCTKETPYFKESKDHWEHPSAIFIKQRDWDNYSEDVFNCPICNLTFSVELPQ